MPRLSQTLIAASAALIAVFCAPSWAQDPQTCAAIDDSLRRLDCFDRMFPRVSAPEKTADRDLASPWRVTEERSPIDDSPTVSAVLAPERVSYTGLGRGTAFLAIRCRENTTSLIVSTNMFMVADPVKVTTRIGDQPSRTSGWNRSTDYKAVGLWRGGDSIPLLKEFVDDARFVVRIEEDDTITAEYNLADVSAQIGKIRAACNW